MTTLLLKSLGSASRGIVISNSRSGKVITDTYNLIFLEKSTKFRTQTKIDGWNINFKSQNPTINLAISIEKGLAYAIHFLDYSSL